MATETVHGEQNPPTQSGTHPNIRQSTTQSSDAGKHATNESGGRKSSGYNGIGNSRAAATTSPADASVTRTTENSITEGDESNSDYTVSNPDASGNEPTTTSYENYLQNIKLNLSFDFALSDLTPEQRANLEDLRHAYGFDPSNATMTLDGRMKQALFVVAAKMSPQMRQTLGFQLKDLVSACIINGEPFDMLNDFKHTFDVEYGNCYTFNYDTPVKHITRRTGTSFGLRMTIFSNSTETIPSSEQGVKVVLHNQDIQPFPNVEGYRSPLGTAVSLQVTQRKFSKLGQPYGNCSSLESVAKNKQPFYYNGSYSIEGCFRSCFQRNIATACGCADPRFPSPTDMSVPFCDPLEPTKYKCMETYIEDNGDYFAVKNCKCYDACEDTAYKSQVFEGVWPAGNFFYGGFCPRARKLDPMDCSEFYSNNGMNLEVSFAQLGYEMIAEEPTTSAWALINNLAGNSGLWIGFTMLGFTEIVLVVIQFFLWICGLPELPFVPSFRHRNFFADVDEDSEGSVDGESIDRRWSISCDAEAIDEDNDPFDVLEKAHRRLSLLPSWPSWRAPPKNFDNIIAEAEPNRRDVEAQVPLNLELDDPNPEYEPVVPVLAHTFEQADHVARI